GADRPLGVVPRGRREDQPTDQEDDGRQPERDRRGDAERVVDRGTDVAVRGREQRRSAGHAPQPLLLAPPPRHRGTLLSPRYKQRFAVGLTPPTPRRLRRLRPMQG